MTIYNDADCCQITCDYMEPVGGKSPLLKPCTETIEAYSFDDALDIMQRNGWLYRKEDDGEWHHYCPQCKVLKFAKPDLKAIF